jgi:AcrR family transcriptional regulator/transposase-like protein
VAAFAAIHDPPDGPLSGEWSDERCLEWLWRARFSKDGTTAYCHRCGCTRRHHRARSRRSWECQHCGNHIHPTAGTVLAGSRTSLAAWFRTIALVQQGGDALTARQVERELGVTYKTAGRMLRVIRTALDGRVGLFSAQWLSIEGRESGTSTSRGGEVTRRSVRAENLRSVLGESQLDFRSDALQQILLGACQAMARRGFVATRAEDIAAAAGVSVPTVYRYFETKQDALLAAIDWADRDGTKRREKIVNSSAPPIEKMARFLDLVVPDAKDTAEAYALYLDLWGRAARDHALRPMVERSEGRWHTYFRRLTLEGVSCGEFRLHRELDATVEYLVATSVGLALPSTVGCRSMSKSRLRSLLFGFANSELGLGEGALEATLRASRQPRADVIL